jgi:uncharacterized membrane protein
VGYFELLLLIHIAGAIVGFGPTFGFGVLGPLAGKLEGPVGLGALKGIVAIEKKLVYPFAFVVQPLTGVLLIFESGRNENFFSHQWLWIGIILYVITFYTAVFVQTPAIERMIELAESGNAGNDEFQALVKKTKTFGPIMGILLLTIIFLMVAKPGSPEGFF